VKYTVLLGRILYSFLFVRGGIRNISMETVPYAAAKGLPIPNVLVPLAGAIVLLGGLSVLFGFKARWGAWFIVIFLVPVTAIMHNFWAVADPAARQMQMGQFISNTALLGAALLIAHFGSGPLSLDSLLKGRQKQD